MRRWPLFMLLAALAGCASDPGPDYSEADGPYYYDGGYYDAPRPVDVGVEQRAYYSYYDSYPYYARPYPYYYGGYRRYYHRPDTDYRHDDHNDRGRDRERIRADRSPEPPPRRMDSGDRERTRVVPDRPAKINTGDRGGNSNRGNGNRPGGPRGSPGRR